MVNADDNCWEKKQTNKKKKTTTATKKKKKTGKLNNRGFKNFLEVLP